MTAAGKIIADSSIWIDQINKGDTDLARLLRRRAIALHPMVIGEIALGSIANRAVILKELEELPQVLAASHAEVMAMIGWLKVFNVGIGYVDAHLLAAARQQDMKLWTRDKALHKQAARLGVAYEA